MVTFAVNGKSSSPRREKMDKHRCIDERKTDEYVSMASR